MGEASFFTLLPVVLLAAGVSGVNSYTEDDKMVCGPPQTAGGVSSIRLRMRLGRIMLFCFSGNRSGRSGERDWESDTVERWSRRLGTKPPPTGSSEHSTRRRCVNLAVLEDLCCVTYTTHPIDKNEKNSGIN